MPLILSTSPRAALPLWKRALDISCCVVALPFLAFAAFWAAVITQLSAPGPIFFRQERVGHNGRRFFIYKFRTMHVSANVLLHQKHFSHLMKSNVPMQKLDVQGDARLISGGWILRASGVDELPQVINVLRGDMSIVGPRPCIPYEYENYTAWQRRRLESVPGMTGLWQVSGKNRTTFDEMVRLDIAYGEKLSFAADLRIILRTLPALWMQISDTRKARRMSARAASHATARPADDALLGDAVSATYLTHSRNVIGGAMEEHGPSNTRQSREASVLIRTDGGSQTIGRRSKGDRPPV